MLHFLEARFSASLERLGVDSVELLYTHRPDDDTPIEDTLEGLEAIRVERPLPNTWRLQRRRSPTHFCPGCCTTTRSIEGYQVVQNRYSLLQPAEERAVRSVCVERGVAFTAYSPLASGVLTGMYLRAGKLPSMSRLALRPDGNEKLLTPAVHDAIDRLQVSADGHGIACGALALAWLLHQQDVSAPIIGPGRVGTGPFARRRSRSPVVVGRRDH